ncbi:MAG: type III-B CRISPR module-associated Cmr3 family protein, partial [Anaerolineae bacterium]
APFCRLVDDVVELYTPLRRFSVHTQRDRQMGRATRDSGAVFRYEALAPNQTFGAAILFDNEADVDILRPLLAQGGEPLGGSHSAGYGLVSIQVAEPQDNWREIDASPTDIPAGDPFTLTLLSDALIREGNGQYATTLTGERLADWLGVGEVKIHNVFKQSSVIGGFNRKWGLPLPQTPVIRAGSVFVLEANVSISAEAMTSLESRGIGYRRVEGLGRVAINWHGQEYELRLERIKPPEVIYEPLADLTGESLELAQRMTKYLLQREVDGKLTDYINTLDFKPRGISPSQIARMRVIVRSAQRDGDTQRVLDWLQDLKPKSPARKQFESARIRGAQLYKWLKDRLATPSNVWAEIGLQQASVPAIGQEQADLTEKLAREVTLRLVDGVLARAIKEVKGQ